MLSTYCGSFSQRGFKKHIAECGVCWEDAQGRSDLDFDAEQVPNPTQSTEQTADDLLTRIGQRIYDDYNEGHWPYDVAEASLETLNNAIGDYTWLGMPIIPEPQRGLE